MLLCVFIKQNKYFQLIKNSNRMKVKFIFWPLKEQVFSSSSVHINVFLLSKQGENIIYTSVYCNGT